MHAIGLTMMTDARQAENCGGCVDGRARCWTVENNRGPCVLS